MERDKRNGEVSVAIEGEHKGIYPDGTAPEWVALGQITVIDLEDGHVVRFGPETVEYDFPGNGTVRATPSWPVGVQTELPAGTVPDWINMSKNRLAVTTNAGRLTVTRSWSGVFRYFYGWELFWFTLDSPYYGKFFSELMGHATSDEAWAIFETILMAFLGTLGAGMIALPLTFTAMRNFNPLRLVRFATRRVFDFVRDVSALIWTVVLAGLLVPAR